MDANFLMGLLAIITLGGVVAFAMFSKYRIEQLREDDSDDGSSLS
jgi:hypothetical protein